jgi:pimeloyl-ACP methyl ester carboxylesterase
MSGTDGPAFLRKSARDVHETLPHSRFVEFDGVGHSGPGEAPGLISSEVTSFLDR